MGAIADDSATDFTAFNAATLKAWEAAAREELNGENPWEKLDRRGEGWIIHPYYSVENAPNAAPLLEVSKNEYLGARTWFNCPRIRVTDTEKANDLALSFLQQGADGILFELQNSVNFNDLLAKIDPGYCSLNFLVRNNQFQVAAALRQFLAGRIATIPMLPGAFFGNECITTSTESNFRFSGFSIPDHANPSESIAAGFRIFAEQIFDHNQLAVSVNLGTDFFIELCKLRAIRQVWKKLIEKRKLTHSQLLIHAVATPWVEKNFEPHGNMLKSTTAAMAAILGGCDLLTVDSENNDQMMTSRIARNVSNILREESFLSKVADPTAGSYFIEDLTQQIAEGAWKLIEKP